MIAIGQAAHLSGIGIETIRYYEREGIVDLPARSQNGRRVYSRADVADLAFIRRCRDLGFQLTDVRALLALSHGREEDCERAREFAAKHLVHVRMKLAELQRIEAALSELTRNCAEGSTFCPMLTELRGVP